MLSIGSAAAQVDTLVQPHGTAIPGLTGVPVIQFGYQANTYAPLGATPTTLPFANAEPAGVVRTTEQTEYYVRLYSPPTTAPNRSWIMRASTVRGLTPEQLRDRFALPFMPTYITNVLVPSGTCLLSGIAGPIAGWGTGGAQQTWIVGHDSTPTCRYDFLVLGVNYINQRPLGANALWYAPVVGPGNAGSVGSYLDHLPAPVEYSDLFNAYNTLDVLNDGTAARLGPALTELSGENHASVLSVALNNADRSARTLSDHARGAFSDMPSVSPSAMMSYAAATPAASAPTGRGPASGGQWWIGGGGAFGRLGGSDTRSGYHYGTGQGIVGYDWRVPDWLVGAAVAVESSNLTVDGASNANDVTTLRAGAYGATEFAGVAFGASALLSWDHYVTSRELPTFARVAAATYDGWSAALSLDASRAFTVGAVWIEPLAGITLVRLSRQGFTEDGAGALALAAESANLTKLASRIGASLSTTVRVDSMRLHPWLRAFWAHDFCDTDGPLTASFAGATAPGTFTILAASRGRDMALVGLGARLEVAPQSSVMVAYDGELGRNAAHHSLTAGVKLQW